MQWMRGIVFLLVAATVSLHAGGLNDPKDYSKNSSLQWQWALSAIDKYPWAGNEKVLDVGCGDGKITAYLSKECSKSVVVGLDISPKMLAFASSLFANEVYSNLIFQEGNIASLPFHGQFDIVTAFCSLNYVVDQEEGLKCIHACLIPDGKLLFVGPGKDNSCLGTTSEDLVKTEKWAPHFPEFKKQRAYFTKDEYIALLKKTGFEPIYFDVTHDRVKFANEAALIDWLRPIVNYTSHLSEPLREEFLKDIATIMMHWAVPLEGESILLESTLFECLCERTEPK